MLEDKAARGRSDDIVIDPIDRLIVTLLAGSARMPNSEIAARVGVAPSTCLLRTRRLVATGAIEGFHAKVNPAALGLTIQAIVSIRLQASARHAVGNFTARLARLPGVMNVYFLGGPNDFQVHVAAASADHLREFVVRHLSATREVAWTETALIFEHAQPPRPWA